MIIRNIERDEVIEAALIEKECFSESEAASPKKLLKRFDNFKECFFGAFINGKMTGYIAGPIINSKVISDDMYDNVESSLNGCYLAVFSIAVLKEYQHQSIGRSLLKHFISFAKDKKLKGVVLASRESKIDFYKHLGFTLLGKSNSTHGNTLWYDMIYEF